MMTTNFVTPTVKVADIQDTIEQAMDAVENTMQNVVNSDVDVLRDASRHILGAGGKRIRPRLLMLTYMALGGTDWEHASAPAAAVELIHTASVVHDDINDHGVLRRGRPSVNAIWGRTFALLTGDFLFTAVYTLLAPYKDLNITLAAAARALVEGETLQAAAVKNNNFTREIYTKIIALKTAALFESATDMGAQLAHATPKQTEALRRFGYNVGLAFQIIDDVLDIVGDEKTLGKTSGIDVQQGRGFASITDTSTEPKAADLFESVKSKLLEGNRLNEFKQQAEALVTMAIAELDVLPDSPAKEEMIKVAYSVIRRDH
jgi:octaprenyl-diphosphate synthase